MDAKDRLIDAMLTQAPELGFRDLRLRALAKAADLTLAEAWRLAPSLYALVADLGARYDGAVLASAQDSDTLSDHDALFEAAMARFDAMLKDRPALRALWTDLKRDPVAWLHLAPAARRALEVTLIAAGREGRGLGDHVAAARLALDLYQCFLMWIVDDDPGQARLMAELDRRLKRRTKSGEGS